MTTWKTLFLRIAKTSALLAAALFTAGALVFALAQTGAGKNTLARLLATALSKDEIRKVELGPLSGSIPFNFQLESLSISDEQGYWLVLDRIRVRWSPHALLGGRFFFPELTAHGVEVLRMPEGNGTASGQTPVFPQWLGALGRLRVDRLAAERIVLGEALAGESAVFILEAKIGETSPEGEKQTLLRLEQIDRPGASLVIRGVYKIPEEVFSLNARFEEIRGGLVARRIGLEGPLAFSFDGRGPLREVTARLEAHAGGIGLIDSQVFMEMKKELRVLAEGMIRLDPQIAPVPPPGLKGDLPFNLSLRIPETGTLMIERFALEAADFALDLEASLDPQEQTLAGRYRILLRDPANLQPFLKEDVTGRIKAEGHFSGPLLRPQSDLRIEMTGASWLGAKASSMEADLRLDLLEDLGSSFPRMQIAGSGALEGFVFEGFEGLSRKRITWEASLHGPEEDGLHLSRFLIISGEESLQLSGIIDPSEFKGDLDLAFESVAPAGLLQSFGLDLPWLGPTLLKASVQADAQGPYLKSDFHAKSALLGEHLPLFLQAPEQEISYGAALFLDQSRILKAPRVWLEGGGATLEGQGSFDFDRNFLLGSWDFSLSDPALFMSMPDLSATGPVAWAGAVEGPLDRLKISTNAQARHVEVSGVPLEKIGAVLRGTYSPSMKEGEVSLDLFQEERWIKARSDFALDAHRLELSGIAVEGFESALKGKATLDLERRQVQGELSGNISDLSLLFALLGQDIRGQAQGEAMFRLGGDDQVLALSIEASLLETPFAAVRNLTVKGRMTGSVDNMEGFVDIAFSEGRISDLSLSSLAFKARGDMGRAAFELDARGRYGEDFEAGSSGTFAFSEGDQRVELRRLVARYGPAPIALTQPTAIIHEKGTFRLEETSFSMETGSFRGSGTYASSHVGFDLSFQDLPLELLRFTGLPGLKGKASGTLVLGGRPESPEARFELIAAGLGLEEAYFPHLPSPSLELKGSLSDHRLKADLSFQGLTPDPLKASADFPLVFTVAPLLFSLDSQGPMEVDLHGEVPLPHAASLLGLDDQKLGGRAEADLKVSGPVASPRLAGRLRLIDGVYENFRTGTILKGATLLITAENGRLEIQEAAASDGEKGIVSLTGWFDLSPQEDFPFRLEIALRDATLIRHDTATARTRGNLVFSGNRKGALLSGEVTVDPLEVRIPGRLPPEIADLEIIEIHKGEKPGEKESPVREMRRAARDPFLQVRVTVVIPGRGHLAGRGLDSEWQGRLEVEGPAGEPSVSGDLAVVRGHFNFLGKRFNLTRGVVSFLGDFPPSPVLDVTGEASTREMTAILKLSGKVSSPELSLASRPPMPDDEILSRLLFGRSVTQITPLQALQLANALDVLAGRRGFGLIDHTRRMLGLDLLEIRDLGVELDEAALRVGKYLADNVYIEVEHGLGPETGRASLQWEITPNITIQTEVGINAEAGAGIRWKWDY